MLFTVWFNFLVKLEILKKSDYFESTQISDYCMSLNILLYSLTFQLNRFKQKTTCKISLSNRDSTSSFSLTKFKLIQLTPR